MRSAVTGGILGAIAAWAARGRTLMDWPAPVRQAFPIAIGTGVGLLGAGLTEVGIRSHAIVRRRKPVHALRTPILVAAGIGGLAWAARTQHKRFLGGLFEQGRTIDASYQEPPQSPLISGGVDSAVAWPSVGRQGARFLHSAVAAEDIDYVGFAHPKDAPIRVYVGYDSAPTVEERVALAIADLRRTGAFDRSVLLVQAPAGTGYANATPVEIVEMHTGGDCASVVVGYGLLPSFLSLDRIRRGVHTQRVLLEAIAAEKPRARILLFGESLGAAVQQGALTASLLTEFNIDRVLWVGTPGSARARWPEALVLDNPTHIPPHSDARVWLLEHDADPVVRMTRSLTWRKPEWLHGDRGRGVPDDMDWKPLVTHAQVLVDVVFATNVRPGEFESKGHDYRADLAAVVSAAFGFPWEPGAGARLDERLRALEIARAARIAQGDPATP